jgi:hypothetical protein
MLLVLHSSLVESLNSSGESDSIFAALDNIATGRREGKHLIYADPEVLKALTLCGHLQSVTRATYSRVAERTPQMKGFVNSLPCYVEVIGGEGILAERRTGSQSIIQVPIVQFSDTSLIQETVLLGEFLTDADLYAEMARTFMAMRKLNGLRVAYEPRPGGGGTTGIVYERLQNEGRRFCLCVIDSDKKCPTGSLGATARAVQRANDNTRPLSNFLVLTVRELENALPTSLYNEAVTESKDMRHLGSVVAQLEVIEHSMASACRPFLDFKEGLTLRVVLAYGDNSPEREYWLTFSNELAAKATISPGCVALGECPVDKRQSCRCAVFDGFGQRILEVVLSAITKIPPRKRLEYLCSYSRDEWERVGGVVFSWTCAGQPIPAV